HMGSLLVRSLVGLCVAVPLDHVLLACGQLHLPDDSLHLAACFVHAARCVEDQTHLRSPPCPSRSHRLERAVASVADRPAPVIHAPALRYGVLDLPPEQALPWRGDAEFLENRVGPNLLSQRHISSSFLPPRGDILCHLSPESLG